MKLFHFYSQFKTIGTNYNQTTKILYRHFTQGKAGTFLDRLKK
ncbi:hypothetical protein [Flavobacterium sp. NKUCC04_CG]